MVDLFRCRPAVGQLNMAIIEAPSARSILTFWPPNVAIIFGRRSLIAKVLTAIRGHEERIGTYESQIQQP